MMFVLLVQFNLTCYHHIHQDVTTRLPVANLITLGQDRISSAGLLLVLRRDEKRGIDVGARQHLLVSHPL